MKVELKEGKKAKEKDISVLEKYIGQTLDIQYREFIETNNGAIPTDNSFPVDGEKYMGGVNEFIAIENILLERKYLNDIPPQAYPIALSEGGNYVFLDQGDGGAIFFWDHEIEGGISKISENFKEFLLMIEPFDASAIKPAPGQVKSAWIDPDFLKQFGE